MDPVAAGIPVPARPRGSVERVVTTIFRQIDEIRVHAVLVGEFGSSLAVGPALQVTQRHASAFTEDQADRHFAEREFLVQTILKVPLVTAFEKLGLAKERNSGKIDAWIRKVDADASRAIEAAKAKIDAIAPERAPPSTIFARPHQRKKTPQAGTRTNAAKLLTDFIASRTDFPRRYRERRYPAIPPRR